MTHSVSFKYAHDFLNEDITIYATIYPGMSATYYEPAEPADFQVDRATLRTTAGDVELGDFLSDETLEEISQHYWDNEDGKE